MPEDPVPHTGIQTGDVLADRYEVGERIGSGGMARVFAARDVSSGDLLAVKVPREELFERSGSIERFEREIDLLQQLTHPNVGPVLHAGTYGGRPYLVMPRLTGDSLKQRVANTSQTPQEVVAWLVPIAAGLDAIHAAGLLHRDVKPSNILFGEDEVPVLIDLGIAKQMGAEPSAETIDRGTPGTPDFMGPEVEATDELSPAYDVFALSCTAFVALGGTLPWEGTIDVEGMKLKRKRGLPGLPSGLPESLSAVLKRGAAPEPGHRYASCSALAEAFRSAVSEAPEARAEDRAGEKDLLDTWGFDEGQAVNVSDLPEPEGGLGAEEPEPDRTRTVSVRRGRTSRTNQVLLGLVVLLSAILLGVVLFGGGGRGGATKALVDLPTVFEPAEGAPVSVQSPKINLEGRAKIGQAVQLRVQIDRLLDVEGSRREPLVKGHLVPVGDAGTFKEEFTLEKDGVHEFSIVALDARDRTSEVVVRRVTLDRVRPKITVSRPAKPKGLRVSDTTFELTGRLDDPLATLIWKRVPVEGNPAGRMADGTGTAGDDGSFSIPIPLEEDGAHRITLRATDAAENFIEEHVEITFDSTAPTITVKKPVAGSKIYTPAGRIRVEGTLDEVPASLLVWDRHEVAVGPDGRFSGWVPVPGDVEPGQPLAVPFKATDGLGNPRTLVVEGTRGADLIVLGPTDGFVTNASSARVHGTVADTGGRLTINDQVVQPNPEGMFEKNVSLSGEGPRAIRVVYVDRRGGPSEITLTVTRDVTAPVLKLSRVWNPNARQDFARVEGGFRTAEGNTLDVRGKVIDETDCTVEIHGSKAEVSAEDWKIAYRPMWQHSLHGLRIVARDEAGNETLIVRNMTVGRMEIDETGVSRRGHPPSKKAHKGETRRPEYALMKEDSVRLIHIPGGTFRFGAVGGDSLAAADERPARSVDQPPFLITRTEITWAQFLAQFKEREFDWPADRTPKKEDWNKPVTGISYEEALAWCKWAGLRLPSEMEWERAARGGVSGQVYSWGDGLTWRTDRARVKGSGEGTADVESSGSANGFGLYDVIGNAAEWCAGRIIRGGSFQDGERQARLSARRVVPEGNANASPVMGFRAALDVRPPPPKVDPEDPDK